jgi:phosphatidylserine/phosphatidylglycerophosphate/cardiolipin synthase-like enzyme
MNISRIDLNSLSPLREQNFRTHDNTTVTPVFRDIPKIITDLMKRYDSVFGCVAWLNAYTYLNHLLDMRNVSILIQKEKSYGEGELDRLYKRLAAKSNLIDPSDFQYIYQFVRPIESLRCVGNLDRKGGNSTMHHKFLVFGDTVRESIIHDGLTYHRSKFIPRVTVTGSFNLTLNAKNSLENIVVIPSSRVSKDYLEEWERVYLISENITSKVSVCSPDLLNLI